MRRSVRSHSSDEPSCAAWPVLASVYGELYGRREKLSLFGRTLLANAMFVGGGDRKQAQALEGRVQLFTAQSAKFLNSVHSPGAASAVFPSVSNPIGISITDVKTLGSISPGVTSCQACNMSRSSCKYHTKRRRYSSSTCTPSGQNGSLAMRSSTSAMGGKPNRASRTRRPRC